MEEAIHQAVDAAIPVVEAIGAVVIVAGVLVTFGLWLASELRLRSNSYEELRLRLARHLALGLEFQLGADLLGTAISPSFEEIGRLAAIAAIRTLLTFFLQRDLEVMRGTGRPDPMPGGR